MKRIYYILFSLIFIGFSCQKSKTNDTVLSFHCIDGSGNATQGTHVLVYSNSGDFQNNANIADSGTTDANGNISFTGVNAQKYYFICLNISNCLYNFGAQATNGSISANETNTVTVVITPYGKLTVTNTSAAKNPYEIKLNGQVWLSSLVYGSSYLHIMPLGNCTVEAIQLSGYVSTPTDSTYTELISQCQTTTLNIP